MRQLPSPGIHNAFTLNTEERVPYECLNLSMYYNIKRTAYRVSMQLNTILTSVFNYYLFKYILKTVLYIKLYFF